MASALAGVAMNVSARRGEHPLPRPFPAGLGGTSGPAQRAARPTPLRRGGPPGGAGAPKEMPSRGPGPRTELG